MAKKKQVTKADVLKFLRSSKCAALSTADKNCNPQVATVYFGVDDKFNFYIPIGTESRKYANLKRNKKIAFMVADKSSQITIQIEGEVEEIERLKKNSKAVKILTEVLTPTIWQTIKHIFDPLPPVLKTQSGDLVLLRIKPKWMRWADFSLTESDAGGNYFQEIIP